MESPTVPQEERRTGCGLDENENTEIARTVCRDTEVVPSIPYNEFPEKT